jgi:formylglycine-generating enzyme required for sulfatase activity
MVKINNLKYPYGNYNKVTYTSFLVLFFTLSLSCSKKTTNSEDTKNQEDLTQKDFENSSTLETKNTKEKYLNDNTEKKDPRESDLADADEENTIDKGKRPPRPAKEIETLDPPSFPPPASGEMISISAGTFLRGSAPHDKFREHSIESPNVATKMTAFEMDVLPWPNDPALEFLTNISKNEANELCKTTGKRLCTELELEWACKGTENRRYIAGNLYHQAAYKDPLGSASALGVYAMGKILEMSSSPWGEDEWNQNFMAVKGYSTDATFYNTEITPQKGRRCAQRYRFSQEAKSSNLGFRCCKGPENKEEYTTLLTRHAHSVYEDMSPELFAQIIKSIPQLEAVSDNPRMFTSSDIRVILARRRTDRDQIAKEGIHFNWFPVKWSPTQGLEVLLLSGRSDHHSFIAALYIIEEMKEYVHATSLVLWDNTTPIALVFTEGLREEVYWAPCWRCRDGGSFIYSEDKNEIFINYRW